jgi:uncharacterized protein
MKLDLDRQAAGRSEIPIEGPLDLGMRDGHPSGVQVSGSLVVQNLESRVLLNGTLSAEGRTECGRCLAEFKVRWEIPVEIMVLRDVASQESEGETLLILQKSGEVDLRESLRQCAALAYPQVPVCRPDCKGLCPQCGVDRNRANCDCSEEEVDPRWEGLP